MRQPDADTNGRNLRLVLLVADPGLPSEMARDLAFRLPEDLRRRIARGICWQADIVTAPLVADEQVDVAHVAEIVGTRLEDGDWDIGVFLTDLPSRMERNPVSTEVEPEHRVALISLLALGSGVCGAGCGRRWSASSGNRQRRTKSRWPVVGVGRPGRTRSRVDGLRGRARCAGSVIRGSRGWCRWTRCVPCQVQRVEGRPSPNSPCGGRRTAVSYRAGRMRSGRSLSAVIPGLFADRAVRAPRSWAAAGPAARHVHTRPAPTVSQRAGAARSLGPGRTRASIGGQEGGTGYLRPGARGTSPVGSLQPVYASP